MTEPRSSTKGLLLLAGVAALLLLVAFLLLGDSWGRWFPGG